MDKTELLLALCAILIIAAIFNLGNLHGRKIIKNQAIQSNCAQYHPQTGKFMWRNIGDNNGDTK